jgi:hypothetical protein
MPRLSSTKVVSVVPEMECHGADPPKNESGREAVEMSAQGMDLPSSSSVFFSKAYLGYL